MMSKKAMSTEEVSISYGVPRGSLANMRSRGEGPRFYKRGRRVVYFVEDIENWLRSEPHQTKHSIEAQR
jgi:hypothetical protein